MKNNIFKYLVSEFFMNMGRTLPHAILTIFLLSQKITLTQLAIVQSIYMFICMTTEFPSGILADFYSRKKIYIVSIFTLISGYILIGFFSSNFYILSIGYALYGLSVSLKSGTVEADIIKDIKCDDDKIKSFTIYRNYISISSSLIGGFIGSILYYKIKNYMYICSIVLFIISYISIYSYREDNNQFFKHKNFHKNINLTNEIQDILKLFSNKGLIIILTLVSISSFFIQPFFQYWQVLYKEINISQIYFGYIYILFQIIGLCSTYIYNKFINTERYIYIILLLIPVIYSVSMLNYNYSLFILPLTVLLFFVYSIQLDILISKVSPDKYISSYFSLSGSIQNIFSMLSMFLITGIINKYNIFIAYQIMFTIFSVISILLISLYHIFYKK